MCESTIGLFKTEAINDGGPSWKNDAQVEWQGHRWVHWCNHDWLHCATGKLPLRFEHLHRQATNVTPTPLTHETGGVQQHHCRRPPAVSGPHRPGRLAVVQGDHPIVPHDPCRPRAVP